MRSEVAFHPREGFVAIAEGSEEVIESRFFFWENHVILTVRVRFGEEKAQHQVSSKVYEEDSTWEGKDMF